MVKIKLLQSNLLKNEMKQYKPNLLNCKTDEMIANCARSFKEVVTGKVLVGLVNKINKEVETVSA